MSSAEARSAAMPAKLSPRSSRASISSSMSFRLTGLPSRWSDGVRSAT